MRPYAPGFAPSAQRVLNIGLVPAKDRRLMISDNEARTSALRQSLGIDVKPFLDVRKMK